MPIKDFLDQVPCPPSFTKVKGEKKIISVTLDPEEYEVIQYLAHHPAFSETYEGKVYQPMRHLIYAFAWEVAAQAEADWEPPLSALKQRISTYNLEVTRDAVNELYDK